MTQSQSRALALGGVNLTVPGMPSFHGEPPGAVVHLPGRRDWYKSFVVSTWNQSLRRSWDWERRAYNTGIYKQKKDQVQLEDK